MSMLYYKVNIKANHLTMTYTLYRMSWETPEFILHLVEHKGGYHIFVKMQLLYSRLGNGT